MLKAATSRCVLACAAIASGCYVARDYPLSPTWSDDDEWVAFDLYREKVRFVDRKDTSSDARTKSLGSQVFIVPADLSDEARAITSIDDDVEGGCLMSRAGYHLVLHVDDSGRSRLLKFSLEGEKTVILDSEQLPFDDVGDVPTFDGVPSPDGTSIAMLVTGGSPRREKFAVLDAATDLYSLSFVDLNRGEGVHSLVRWTTDGQVFLHGTRDSKALEDALLWNAESNDLETIVAPTCQGPQTSCGRVSESGVPIIEGGSRDEPFVVWEDPPFAEGDWQLLPFACEL